jgi:hypothetical protein
VFSGVDGSDIVAEELVSVLSKGVVGSFLLALDGGPTRFFAVRSYITRPGTDELCGFLWSSRFAGSNHFLGGKIVYCTSS